MEGFAGGLGTFDEGAAGRESQMYVSSQFLQYNNFFNHTFFLLAFLRYIEITINNHMV